MNWLDRLENKFGHLAITGLPWIIAGINLLVYTLWCLDHEYTQHLDLDPHLIMKGQVWRLVTFAFIPSWGGFLPSWLGIIFYLLFIVFVGNTLEQAMGSFRLNLYYLLGMIGIIAAGFISGGGGFGNAILNLSLLFALAWYLPDAVIYFWYVLPMKIKWVAWILAALLGFEFLVGPWDYKLALIASLLNYIVFFGPQIVRNSRDRQEVAQRRSRYERQTQDSQTASLHECSVCKRTEVTSPELEFRVARDGQEYCLEHLPKPVKQG
jgi:type IV secretory pathway VirB2 component (pilin)